MRPSQAFEIAAPVPAANRTDQSLSRGRFEAVVEDEIYRLANCARTNDFDTWCVAGDAEGWNVSNAERLPGGDPLAALGRSVELDTSSQRWSEHLVDFAQIFHSEGSGSVYGENVAYNPKLHAAYELTPAHAAELAGTLMQQWMDSPAHRVQIMNPAYETFGCGVAVEVSDPSPDTFVEIWGTQQFQ